MEHFTFSVPFKNSHLSFNLSIHLLRSGGAFDAAIMGKDIINHTNEHLHQRRFRRIYLSVR